MSLRLNPNFGRLLGESAEAHGITLALSYRPFEAALTKYYEVPAFDSSGDFLWNFMPLASPTTNYHPEEVGWTHYRQLLREQGSPELANIKTIHLAGVPETSEFVNSDSYEILATQYPPLAEDSFVLVRDDGPDQTFQLRSFREIRELADRQVSRLTGFQVKPDGDGLSLTELKIPQETRYLLITWKGKTPGPVLRSLSPVTLFGERDNQLGRETVFWAEKNTTGNSRVAGITHDGEYRAEFQAAEFSQRAAAAGPETVSLSDQTLVIDLGARWTSEILDFNQERTRQNAVREIKTVLDLPGFDELFLSTRSHVDLPVSTADGDAGIQPAGFYWQKGTGLRNHLGLDKAYSPRSEASLSEFRQLMRSDESIRQFSVWQPDEWKGTAQTPDGRPWRYLRNRGTADGLRRLLEDLRNAFPKIRIRAVIPPQSAAVAHVLNDLRSLPMPEGGYYGESFYSRLWPSNNFIPDVGEGMAMVNLQSLSVEPVFFGSGGYLSETAPIRVYIQRLTEDLADNRGSDFRGTRSYFFEAQMSLRAEDPVVARKKREDIIRHILSFRNDIGEVILYEAADWLYYLPLSDQDLCGHGFLDP
jgi:hypothetical protein